MTEYDLCFKKTKDYKMTLGISVPISLAEKLINEAKKQGTNRSRLAQLILETYFNKINSNCQRDQ